MSDTSGRGAVAWRAASTRASPLPNGRSPVSSSKTTHPSAYRSLAGCGTPSAVAGEGGMGIVYRAADTLLHDRTVAVKVMAAHLSAEPAYRAAFLHEAQVAAEVSHPNVVPVHAAGEADGLLYLAMAWIDGPNLREIGALSITRAITLVRQVARAIDALHEAGIVHGDIKPSNSLVHREDHAYLVDFGVARRSE